MVNSDAPARHADVTQDFFGAEVSTVPVNAEQTATMAEEPLAPAAGIPGTYSDMEGERSGQSPEPSARAAGAASREVGDEGRFEVVVVGAGQAGLAIGFFLARQGRRFVILEATGSVGAAW